MQYIVMTGTIAIEFSRVYVNHSSSALCLYIVHISFTCIRLKVNISQNAFSF